MRRGFLAGLIVLGFVSLASASPGKPYTGWVATGVLPSGSVTIDAGFPVSFTRNSASGQSTTQESASFTAPSGHPVFVVLSLRVAVTAMLPPTISNSGSSLGWTSIRSDPLSIGVHANVKGVYIWRGTGDGSAHTITITVGGLESWTAVCSVISLSGTSGTIGASNSYQDGSGDGFTQAISLTTTANSLVLGGAVADDNVAVTPRSGTTSISSVVDTPQWANPWTFRTTDLTISGTTTVGSDSTQGYLVISAIEVLPDSLPTIDNGFPVWASVFYGTGPITSFSITGVTTTKASRLVAVITGDRNTFPLSNFSGGGLTWSKISSRTNGGGDGVEIWSAISSSSLSNVTFTATYPGTVEPQSQIVVYSLQNVNSIVDGGTYGAISGGNGNAFMDVTTTQPNALIVGGYFSGGGTDVFTGKDRAGQVTDHKQNDPVFGGWMSAFHKYQSTPGTVTIGYTDTIINDVNFASVLIYPNVYLPGWASIGGTGATYASPGITVVSTTNNTSTVNVLQTTSEITVPSAIAGDVLVAILPVSSNTSTSTQTSPNLTWTRQIKQPAVNDGNGRVEIWTAVASSTLTNEVVTSTYSGANYIGHSITVVRGANTTSFSTVGTTNYPSSWVADPSLTLTGTTNGSLILWGAQSFGAGATTFTPDGSQTTFYLIHGGVTDRYWVGRRTSLSPGGDVTVTGTFDIDSWWQAAAIEIKPL